MEDMIQDKVGAKEAELHAAYDERLRNYDERYVKVVSFAKISSQDTDKRSRSFRIAGRRICNDKLLSLDLSYANFEQRQTHLKLDSSTILNDKVRLLVLFASQLHPSY